MANQNQGPSSEGLHELNAVIDANWTRGGFADEAGISEPYLSQILSGARPFSRVPVGTAMKISKLSGISIDRLAGMPIVQRAAPPDRRRAGRQ